jgi:hypothetical protein
MGNVRGRCNASSCRISAQDASEVASTLAKVRNLSLEMNAVFYDRSFGAEGKAFFRRVAEKFDNLYVFVRRVAPYVPHARMTSQAEADRMAEVIREFLVKEGISFFEVDGDMAAPAKIVDWLETSGAIEPRLL